MCLSFERLGMSLYEYLKQHQFLPFHLSTVKEIACQLVHAIVLYIINFYFLEIL